MGPMDNSEHILVLHSLTMLNQDFTGVIQKSVTTGFTQYSFSLAYELKKRKHILNAGVTWYSVLFHGISRDSWPVVIFRKLFVICYIV